MLDIKPSQVVVNLGWVQLPKTFFSNPKKGEFRYPSYPTPPNSNMPTQKLQRYSYEILDKFWDFSDRSFLSRTL
jgi:hypothetical protein